MMNQSKHAMKEFVNNLVGYLGSLIEYLSQVKKDRLLKANFNLINKTRAFQEFKQVFLSTKGTTLIPVKIEELFLGTFEKMEASHSDLIENAITLLNERIAEIKSISFAVGT